MMRFQVVVDGLHREVELAFGSEPDLAVVSRWHPPAAVTARPTVRDTLEFARLAAKRWRYYRRSIATATSFEVFKALVAREPQSEVSALLVVHADWFSRSRVIGLAQCRRTYCHHLVLEFLSVHPAIVGRIGLQIRGVGSGLVYGLAEFAGMVGMPLIWGEATASSATFYAKTLAVSEITDHFFIQGPVLAHCRRQFREEFLGQA